MAELTFWEYVFLGSIAVAIWKGLWNKNKVEWPGHPQGHYVVLGWSKNCIDRQLWEQRWTTCNQGVTTKLASSIHKSLRATWVSCGDYMIGCPQAIVCDLCNRNIIWGIYGDIVVCILYLRYIMCRIMMINVRLCSKYINDSVHKQINRFVIGSTEFVYGCEILPKGRRLHYVFLPGRERRLEALMD